MKISLKCIEKRARFQQELNIVHARIQRGRGSCPTLTLKNHKNIEFLKGGTQSLGGIVSAEVVLAPLGVVHMWLQCFGI